MARWKIKEMLAELDLQAFLQYKMVPMTMSGSTMFAACANPDHHETRPDHMMVKRDHCFCFSCRESYDGLSYLMAYYEKYGGGDASLDSCCREIASYLGNPDRFIENGVVRQVVELPYSDRELYVAGLAPESRRVLQKLYEYDELFVKSIVLSKLDETINKLNEIIRLAESQESIINAAADLRKESGRLYHKLTGKYHK